MRANTAVFAVALECLSLLGTHAFTGPAIITSRSISSRGGPSAASTAAETTAVGEARQRDGCRKSMIIRSIGEKTIVAVLVVVATVV